jgi:transcriptional regulator with XRE-family HTH domain
LGILEGMPAREDAVGVGARQGRRITRHLATEIRTARRMAGVSQRQVAAAVGLSPAEIGRIERDEAPWLSIVDAARIVSVLGLDLWVKTYPAGSPLRDAGHAKLIAAFERRLPPVVTVRREWPIPHGNGQAIDLLLDGLPRRTGVEAETVLEDEQALERRLSLKRDAANLGRMILLVKDSVRNRRAVAGSGLRRAFPAGTRQVLSALARGEDPGADGLVVL